MTCLFYLTHLQINHKTFLTKDTMTINTYIKCETTKNRVPKQMSAPTGLLKSQEAQEGYLKRETESE